MFFSQNLNKNSKSNSSFSYRDRRLILLHSRDSKFESMELRDKINREFQKQLKLPASELVLAAIMKSQKQQNVVLTTMSKYNADYLIQHQKIWQNFFEFSGVLHDKAWFKIVAHGIPTEIFDFSKGLDLLKEEIKTFNGIEPITVNWLSPAHIRAVKKHGSIVIAFNSEATAKKALKNLLIAGISVKTAVFIEKKASEQCLKCQKFGHSSNSCKNIAACQLCADKHPTRLHVCKTCEITGKICIHTVLKCVNCAGNYAANSKECNIVIATAAEKLNSSSNSSSNSISPTNSEMEEEL